MEEEWRAKRRGKGMNRIAGQLCGDHAKTNMSAGRNLCLEPAGSAGCHPTDFRFDRCVFISLAAFRTRFEGRIYQNRLKTTLLTPIRFCCWGVSSFPHIIKTAKGNHNESDCSTII